MSYEKRLQKLEKKYDILHGMVSNIYSSVYSLQRDRTFVSKKEIDELQTEMEKLKKYIEDISDRYGTGKY